MATGALWMILSRLTERGVGLISTLILVRLLAPQDFGLVMMATSIVAILEIMGAFSFDMALIQNQQAERRHYDTAWTFNVLYGAASGIVLVLLAKPTAAYFGEPRLTSILYVLAIGALIQGLDNIGIVAFRKDLEMHKEFWFNAIKRIVTFAVTVGLAVLFKNYWALVTGILTGKLVELILSYRMQAYRPQFSLAAKDELFHFSKWMIINNIMIFINNRGVDLILGKISGPKFVGLYSVAYEISNLPTTELIFPVTRAVFPGYAKLANDLGTLRKGFLDVLSVVVLFTTPIGLGIAVVAEPLVHLFLGEKWLETIPLIQVLALYGVIRAFQANTGAVYLALGKPQALAYVTTLSVLMLIPILIFSVSTYGIQGAAWAMLITAAIGMAINFTILLGMLRLQWWVLLQAIWRPLLAALLMMAIIYYVQQTLADLLSHHAALALTVLVLTGTLSFITALLILWWLSNRPQSAEKLLLNRIGLNW